MERVAALKARFGVTDYEVAIEMRQRRKERRQGVIYGTAVGVTCLLGMVYRDEFGPHSFGHQLVASMVILLSCVAVAKVIDAVLNRGTDAV